MHAAIEYSFFPPGAFLLTGIVTGASIKYA